MQTFSVFSSWIFLLCYYGVSAQLRTNFLVSRLAKCNKTTPTVFYGDILHENGNQYLEFNITILLPVDENIGVKFFIESTLDGKTFLPVFTIRERNMCKAASKYLGEFFYDLERAAQIPPGVCPIREGRYQIHHHLLDFKKISLQTFPFGKLKFTLEAIDNSNSQSLFCLIVEAENVMN